MYWSFQTPISFFASGKKQIYLSIHHFSRLHHQHGKNWNGKISFHSNLKHMMDVLFDCWLKLMMNFAFWNRIQMSNLIKIKVVNGATKGEINFWVYSWTEFPCVCWQHFNILVTFWNGNNRFLWCLTFGCLNWESPQWRSDIGVRAPPWKYK